MASRSPIVILSTLAFLCLCGVTPPCAYARLANYGCRGLYVTSMDEALMLPDDDIDLGTAALIISEEWSDVVHGLRYREKLDAMAEEIKKRLRERKLRANYNAIPVMNEYLFQELGFSAVANADDPNDLFLHSVLDRRKGYCLSLSTLYLALGERLGLPLYGVVVPGHFFVRYDSRSKRFNIECTANGAQLSDEHYIEKHRVPEHHDRLYMENLTKKQTLGCLYNNFGVVYLETGQEERALLALDRSARINPKLAEARSNMSIVLNVQGQNEDALQQLKHALDSNPNDPSVHRELGRTYLKQQDYRQAVRSLKRSVELDPNSPEVFILLSEAYSAQDLNRFARESLEEALALAPEHVYAHASLGQLFQKLRNYQRAVSAYRDALRYDPKRIDVYFLIASCYHELKWTKDEIGVYQEILRKQPREYRAVFNLAQIYAQQRKYPQAIDYLKQAIALKPNDATSYYNLAVCYAETGKKDLAHETFAQALDADPKMGMAHYGIGISFFNQQEYSIAWEHIKRAKELGFDVPADVWEKVASQAGAY